MKTKNQAYQVALAALALGAILGMMVLEERARRKAAVTQGKPEAPVKLAPTNPLLPGVELTATGLEEQLAVESAMSPPEAVPPTQPAQTAAQAQSNAAAIRSLAGPAPRASTKPPPQDPLARLALSLVGADSEADAYWYAAINDPGLSAQERQDLIEDLNEDGLSDPRRPSANDLPLIMSRLLLLEELAPYAMDQVNAEAFAEAYKDLVGLLNGQPPP
jgi:hypothetical protein